MKSLCRPPRVPTSKAHTGGPPPALRAISVLVRIPSPFLPFPDTRDPWGPAFHPGSSPRNLSCPAALSSTSSPCCHGNSGKAGSFLQGQWERKGGRGPAWPLQHPPSTRSPCRCSLPPGFSSLRPLPSPCPHPESWHHPAPPCTHYCSKCPRARQPGRPDAHASSAFILTFVYSANVARALNQHWTPC